jgi:serine protease SohB
VSSDLFSYFLQTLIANGVPAFFVVGVIFFGASMLGKNRNDEFSGETTVLSELYSDLYGDDSKKGGFSFGNRSKNKSRNLGVPSQEFIKISSFNRKLDSYEYSVTAATKSKAAAAATFRSKSFDRAFRLGLESADALPSYAKAQLLETEKVFLTKGRGLMNRLQALQTYLAKEFIDEKMESMGVEQMVLDPTPLNKTATTSNSMLEEQDLSDVSLKGKTKILKEISKVQRKLTQLEIQFVQDVLGAVGPERAMGVRTVLLGDIAVRGTGGLLQQLEERPLAAVLHGLDPESKKQALFVTRFPGDVTASQVAGLREEVTAIIRTAMPGDEALVILQSGGGTVTGYGLAAAQLSRIKAKGLKLTIAVEQVAASGGYMMCCIADEIIASPFAALGSIGVIGEIPNAYERLKREGIEFQTVTAGKYKRTITPTKKVTPEDLKKSEEDIGVIFELFSGFVKENRPKLNMDEIATGEVWFGSDAVEKGLCDEIKTADEALMDFVDGGYNVYDVEYSPPKALVPGRLGQLLPSGRASDDQDSWLRRSIRWAVRTVADEVTAELKGLGMDSSIEKRYMARDDASDHVRIQD